nr:phytochrome b [Quercus suber]
MRDSFQDMEDNNSNALKFIQQNDTEMQGIDELSSMACEMVRLIETATVPIKIIVENRHKKQFREWFESHITQLYDERKVSKQLLELARGPLEEAEESGDEEEDDDQEPYQQNDSHGHQMGFTSTDDQDDAIISLDRVDIPSGLVDMDDVDMN